MTERKTRLTKEDEYFWKLEIEKKKKWAAEQAEKMAAEEKKRRKELHWMKCPKCGMDMEELEMFKVKIDQCPSCGGIFLDHGEIHHAVAAEAKNAGVVARFFKIFE